MQAKTYHPVGREFETPDLEPVRITKTQPSHTFPQVHNLIPDLITKIIIYPKNLQAIECIAFFFVFWTLQLAFF